MKKTQLNKKEYYFQTDVKFNFVHYEQVLLLPRWHLKQFYDKMSNYFFKPFPAYTKPKADNFGNILENIWQISESLIIELQLNIS